MPTISWKAKMTVIFQSFGKLNYLYSFSVNSQREGQLLDLKGKNYLVPKLLNYLKILFSNIEPINLSLEHLVKLSQRTD